jgi:hypothetical protein
MKTLITLVIAATLSLATQAANATSPASNVPGAEKVANLLSNSKIAPCLAKLHVLEKKYDVSVSQLETLRTENDEQSDTVISYMLIEGGDMIMGDASITIRTQLYSQFGFPEGGKIERVIGCKFAKRTY